MTELRGRGEVKYSDFIFACKSQNSQDVLKILFLFPVHHNNYKRMVCSHNRNQWLTVCGYSHTNDLLSSPRLSTWNTWSWNPSSDQKAQEILLHPGLTVVFPNQIRSSGLAHLFLHHTSALSVCKYWIKCSEGKETPQYSAELWFHSFNPSELAQLSEFREFSGWSGFLLLRRDCQTSLSCPPTDPLNSTMPRFGSAWPDPKQLLHIPACAQLCKQPQKLALHGSLCSGSLLGNCKASEGNSHCSTAVLIKTLPIQMSSCPSVGNGKIPKDAEPQHSSGCCTANSGTATPVYDQTPKQ